MKGKNIVIFYTFIFLLSNICCAQENNKSLEEAWINIARNTWDDMSPEMINLFDVKSTSVSRFLSKILEAEYKTGRGGMDRIRMEAVIENNGTNGLVWILCHSRILKYQDTWGIMVILDKLDNSREIFFYLIDLLLDMHEEKARPSRVAKMRLYKYRTCDHAYNHLMSRLISEKKKGAISKEALAFLEKVPDVYWRLSRSYTPAERDEYICKLWNWVQSDNGRKYISSLPSAIDIVRKKGEMKAEADQAERILMACWLRTGNFSADDNKQAGIKMLENEIPLLSEKEKETRRKLKENQTLEKLFNSLNQPTPRAVGHVQWALLQRSEHAEIVNAGIKVYNASPSVELRTEIISVMGDMVELWKQKDKQNTNKILEFLKGITEDTKIHWSSKALAQVILRRQDQNLK